MRLLLSEWRIFSILHCNLPNLSHMNITGIHEGNRGPRIFGLVRFFDLSSEAKTTFELDSGTEVLLRHACYFWMSKRNDFDYCRPL